MTRTCKPLAAGADWVSARPGAEYSTKGDGFDVTISVLGEGDRGRAVAKLDEEVGAVLEGSFHVHAAGESYLLSKGEAIIIPPGEPREWICAEERGVLYRVVVTGPVLAEQ